MAVYGLNFVDALPGRFTKTGWIPPEEGIEYKIWDKALGALKTHERLTSAQLDALRWWIADFLNYGEGTYKERHTQALDGSDYSERGLHNMARVGREVPRDIRHDPEEVTFWKSSEVAGLPKPDKKRILDRAASEKLKRDEIRSEADALRKAGKRVPGSEDFHSPASVTSIDSNQKVCPTCGGSGHVSARKAISA